MQHIGHCTTRYTITFLLCIQLLRSFARVYTLAICSIMSLIYYSGTLVPYEHSNLFGYFMPSRVITQLALGTVCRVHPQISVWITEGFLFCPKNEPPGYGQLALLLFFCNYSSSPSIETRGNSLSSHFGNHQALLPRTAIIAGTNVMRTTKASTKIPTARPKPIA